MFSIIYQYNKRIDLMSDCHNFSKKLKSQLQCCCKWFAIEKKLVQKEGFSTSDASTSMDFYYLNIFYFMHVEGYNSFNFHVSLFCSDYSWVLMLLTFFPLCNFMLQLVCRGIFHANRPGLPFDPFWWHKKSCQTQRHCLMKLFTSSKKDFNNLKNIQDIIETLSSFLFPLS